MFELLWTDHADLASTYDSRAEAEAALLSYATEHPELADEIAVIEIDDQGERVSDFPVGRGAARPPRRRRVSIRLQSPA